MFESENNVRERERERKKERKKKRLVNEGDKSFDLKRKQTEKKNCFQFRGLFFFHFTYQRLC